jgi:hypothetical protein
MESNCTSSLYPEYIKQQGMEQNVSVSLAAQVINLAMEIVYRSRKHQEHLHYYFVRWKIDRGKKWSQITDILLTLVLQGIQAPSGAHSSKGTWTKTMVLAKLICN